MCYLYLHMRSDASKDTTQSIHGPDISEDLLAQQWAQSIDRKPFFIISIDVDLLSF